MKRPIQKNVALKLKNNFVIGPSAPVWGAAKPIRKRRLIKRKAK